MSYVKAESILPESLLEEIQKYIQGEYIYIPSPQSTKKKWGEKSGARKNIKERNKLIREKHQSGSKVPMLAEEFFLSIDSIKKIVYAKNA